MSERLKPCDFRIVSKPVGIEFECPHCDSEVAVGWSEIEVPESWSDSWPEVICPYCGKPVELGEWEYD